MDGMSQWFGAGAVAALAVGAVAAAWTRIKGLAARAVSLVVVTVDLDGDAPEAVARYALRHYRRSPYGKFRYATEHVYVRSAAGWARVAYETIGTSAIVFWRGWRPLSLRFAPPENNAFTVGNMPMTATFLRGTFSADELVREAMDELNRFHQAEEGGRFRVTIATGDRGRRGVLEASNVRSRRPRRGYDEYESYRRYVGHAEDDLGQPVPANPPMSYLALDERQLAAADTIRKWLKSHEMCVARGVPWTLGVALYGPPGTGKSSFARAIAQELDLPVVRYDLATFDNESFSERWTKEQSSAPYVALFEDFHAVFHGTKNVTPGTDAGVTFDCLLNCLSGVSVSSGVLTIVTTNDATLLDPAMGTVGVAAAGDRVRRLNLFVAFGPLDAAGRAQIAARILPDDPDLARECVLAGDGETGNQFENRCVSLARDRMWTGEGAK